MDLDRIKQTWQNAKIKPSIEESQIQKMLQDKSRKAYRGLLIYDILGIILIPFLLVYIFHLKPSSDENIPSYIILIILYVSVFIWQIYKVYFLRKIDFMNMSILEVSEKITTYKKWISREWVAVIICTIIIYLYLIALIYYKEQNGLISENSWMIFAIVAFIFISIAFAIGYLVYIATIKINIQIIEESIKEIEEFQKDNNDLG